MDGQGQSNGSGLWAVLWRSVVFLPYMLFAAVAVGSVWIARWFLPFYAALLLYVGDIWQGIAMSVLWLLCVIVYRRCRLQRFFESPPSLL